MEINKLLFLDYLRNPNDCVAYMYQRTTAYEIYGRADWKTVRSYGEFCDWITVNGMPDLISFDHDLADNMDLRAAHTFLSWYDIDENREYTGMDCAKWLVNYCLDRKCRLPVFLVHSTYPAGEENIRKYLENFRKFQNAEK